ncbi:RhuM family protein [Amycolatopsis speibonae]|uniref:RhuM family protein n=1 Tax=Amycolatopsis speibonae TaxID=1450224 RepID=A0ABV7P6K2_9PSEU
MSELIPFDFDGLDQSVFVAHPEHGPCAHSEKFIRWAGWKRPSDVRRDHLLPGMEVEISILTQSGGKPTRRKVKHLTKRGIRRLLMRSNHPRAEQYSELVLDMLDELDRVGMVVDEKRITDEQIEVGQRRLSALQVKRLQERQDYKNILRTLKLGGATSEGYRHVQDTLYLTLFGQTARQIRTAARELRTWEGKRGPTKSDRGVAKNYLTERELKLLDNTVLAVFAQIDLHYPNGATVAEMVAAVGAASKLTLPRTA